MSYCINPNCLKPNDPANANSPICRNCGSDLFIQGRYQVMRLLSDNSGFGKIYEAYEGSTAKILKVLKEDYNTNPKVVELFQQEAAVLSQLNHPGIPTVKVDGYFQFTPRNSQEPLHCIVMEKIEGPNLKQWMQQQGNHPISEKQALSWLRQLVEILDIVHQHNYFHRDIKPTNIMLRPSGQLVLIDFGTAREMTYTYFAGFGGAGHVTKISSAGYTPPEQEMGHAVPQSDFYALGRTFVYLLTGKELNHKSIYDPLIDKFHWCEHAPDISLQLVALIDKLMAPKAVERPRNTQEILDELSHILTASNPETHLEGRISAQTLREASAILIKKSQKYKNQWFAVVAVALMTGLGGLGVFQFYYRDTPSIVHDANLFLMKTITGHTSYINALTLSADGQTLVSASADKTIKIWNLANGKEIRTLKGHGSYVNHLVINPDGQTLVSASADKTIKIWNLSTGKEMRTLIGHSGYVNFLIISPDGQTLVSGSADKTIKLWNLATGKEIRTLKGHLNSINSLAISPDGQTLASGSADKTIKLWNLTTGKEIRTLKGHSSYINYLVISPDGQTLASGSADKTIKLWDITTGQELRTLIGHTGYVNFLAISPNGQILTSSSTDETIKLWNLTTGKEIHSFTGQFHYVNSLPISPIAISSDGKMIITGNTDKTIKLWQIPS